jgi:putative endonuclease
MKTYYLYILTNSSRTTLYIGITNDLIKRITQHNDENPSTFPSQYKLHHLIYFEEYQDVTAAIDREKQLKKWNRKKKEALIATKNPEWQFLEFQI